MGTLVWLTQILTSLVLFVLNFQANSSPHVSSNSSYATTFLCHQDESLALIQFKNSFIIDKYYRSGYPKTESWKEGTDCCFLWDGVTCDEETGYVIGLNLSNSKLFGTFPSHSSLFLLSHLQYLNLSDNFFNYSLISPQFGQLSKLTYLSLGRSAFVGQIPPQISLLSNLVSLDISGSVFLSLDTATFSKIFGNLTKLRELDLTATNMSAVAPSSLTNISSSNLSSLRLKYCRLQGKFLEYISQLSRLVSLDLDENYDLALDTTDFKMLVRNLTMLRELNLDSVNMSLVSPNSLLNLSSSLSSLKLPDCGLRGEFPGAILQLPNLQFVNLFYNENITGILPPTSNWSSSLRDLYLSGTKITIHLQHDFISNFNSLEELHLRGCNFVGSNLALLSNFTQLTALEISGNNFMGAKIPSSFGKFLKLRSLGLSTCNLTGQIPSSLGNLKQLSSLDLSFNNLSGAIPNFFSNLTQLSFLDLSNNLLNGAIPFSLFALPNLQILRLQNNMFTGQLGQIHHNSSMSYINVSNNKLHGLIPSSFFELVHLSLLILSTNELKGQVPSSVCKMQSLILLDLSNNSLSGSIPNCLGKFSNSLEVLHLGTNNFNGTIPPLFSKGYYLRYINFNGNQLQGEIPISIINCKSLEFLDLGNNKILDTFPYFLGALQHLQVLVLRSNKFHGLIQNFGPNYSFPMLQIFDISNNSLRGPLPSFDRFEAMMRLDNVGDYMRSENYSYEYSTRLTIKGLEIKLEKIQALLTTIDFSCNQFSGQIPKTIGMLKALMLLNLSHNQLTGNIPALLGNLTNLESLDLSSNLLTGTIPEELTNLTFLQQFHVSYNQLVGSIPHSKQFGTFDNNSYEGNSGLCGFPLQKQCVNGKSKQQRQIPLKEGGSKSDENGFGWEVVLVGYICGVLFGLAIGFFVFRKGKHSWFVRMIEVEGYHWRKRFDKIKNTSKFYRRGN